MGSYCVTCALSGVPIHYDDDVIGWNVSKSPYGMTSGDVPFIPTSIPVIGKYDTYGGIEGKLEGDGMVAICHLKLWKTQINKFRHEDFGGNPCTSLVDQFEGIRKEYQSSVANYQKLLEASPDHEFWTRHAKPFNAAWSELHRASSGISYMWYILNKFTLGVEGKVSTKGMKYEEREKIPQEDQCGKFETLLVNGLINGMSKEDLDILEGLVKIHATAIFRNRPILPTQMVKCVQYPDFKQENAWLKAVYEFAANQPIKRAKETKLHNAKYAKKALARKKKAGKR